MNKRIEKKRAQTSPLKIGEHVYSREYIRDLNKTNIGFINCVALYQHIKDPKISRPRIKSLMNYIYKNRERHYLSYKHLKFARHLKPKPEYMISTSTMSNTSTMPKIILGGESIKYNSSTYIRFTEEVKHE